VTRDRRLGRLPAVVVRLLLALPVTLVALLGVSTAPAAAHASLTSTTPTQGSQVDAPPTEVVLTFTEEVGLSDRAVRVTDSRGRRVDDGNPSHVGDDDRTVRVGLGSLGKASYTVTWRVVSVDGHPVSGTFAFGVGVPAGTVDEGTAVDPAVSAVRTVTQLLSYTGAVLLIGVAAFLFLLWPAGHTSARMRRLLIGSVLVAGVGAVGSFLVQGPYVAGGDVSGVVDPQLWAETLGASYGRPLLLRILAVGLSVPVLGIWPRLPEDEDAGPGGVAAAGNVMLLAASFSLTGHAAEAQPRLLAETADVVHLAAAGLWLGGLATLFLAYLPDVAGDARPAARSEAVDLLARWSRTAAAAVVLLLVTGTYQAWREVRSLGALTGTSYGRLLLLKLVVVAGVLAVAAVSRSVVLRVTGSAAGPGDPVTGGRVPRALTLVRSSVAPRPGSASSGGPPSSGGSPPSGGGGSEIADPVPTIGRLRRTVAAETALGVVVLAVTSVLGATPPARTTYGPPFSASVQGRDTEGFPIRVDLDVAPTRVGPQTVRLRAFTPTDEPLPFTSATGQLTGVDGGPVRLSFIPIKDGEGVATNVVVPSAGRWTLTVQIFTTETTAYAARTAYTVR
jgi:copper transport protein